MSKPTLPMLGVLIGLAAGRDVGDDHVARFACRRAGYIDRAGRLTLEGSDQVRAVLSRRTNLYGGQWA